MGFIFNKWHGNSSSSVWRETMSFMLIHLFHFVSSLDSGVSQHSHSTGSGFPKPFPPFWKTIFTIILDHQSSDQLTLELSLQKDYSIMIWLHCIIHIYVTMCIYIYICFFEYTHFMKIATSRYKHPLRILPETNQDFMECRKGFEYWISLASNTQLGLTKAMYLMNNPDGIIVVSFGKLSTNWQYVIYLIILYTSLPVRMASERSIWLDIQKTHTIRRHGDVGKTNRIP